jgi:hypothetical protein
MSNEYDEQETRVELQRTMALTALPSQISGLFGYATEVMKALIFVSAGSAAALLALIGHFVTISQKEIAKAMGFPLCIFLVAAILAAGTFGFSYLSQLCANTASIYLCLWEDERYDALFKRSSKWGYIWLSLALLLSLLAFTACFYGIWRAYRVFMTF